MHLNLDRNSFLAGVVTGLALSYVVLSAVALVASRGRPAAAATPASTRLPPAAAAHVVRPSFTPAPSTEIPAPTQTATATNTSTGTATATSSPTPTWTPVPLPSETPTPLPTETPTPVPSPTPTATPIPFQEQSFEVPPRAWALIRIQVENGQTIEAKVSVDTDVDLVLLDPRGKTVFGPYRVRGSYSLQEMSRRSGEWVLKIDNSFSWLTSKQVTVQYRVY